jgi:hypothetical protein
LEAVDSDRTTVSLRYTYVEPAIEIYIFAH